MNEQVEGEARMRPRAVFTEGSILKHVLVMTATGSIGLVAIFFVDLLSLLYVSWLHDEKLTAGVGFATQILFFFISINIGLSIAIGALVARALGAGDRAGAQRLAASGLVQSCIIAAATSLLAIPFRGDLLALLGARGEALAVADHFLLITLPSNVLLAAGMALSGVLRAVGDARRAMYTTLFGAVATSIADPILIFGLGPIPAMGLEGAALAGIFARMISLIGVLSVMHFGMRSLAPISANAARIKASWGKLLHIGLPSTATQLVTPVSMAIVTKIVASAGTVAIAAYGIASRIEFFALIYIMAVSGSLGPFVGQNAGAGRMDRVREGVRSAARFAVAAGALLALLLGVLAPAIVDRFSDDPAVMAVAVFYLRAVPWSWAPGGLVMVASQTLNSLARPLPASAINLMRSVGVTVPFALVGLWVGGIQGAFIGLALSALVVGVIGNLWMRRIMGEEVERRAQVPQPLARAAE